MEDLCETMTNCVHAAAILSQGIKNCVLNFVEILLLLIKREISNNCLQVSTVVSKRVEEVWKMMILHVNQKVQRKPLNSKMSKMSKIVDKNKIF